MYDELKRYGASIIKASVLGTVPKFLYANVKNSASLKTPHSPLLNCAHAVFCRESHHFWGTDVLLKPPAVHLQLPGLPCGPRQEGHLLGLKRPLLIGSEILGKS